MTFDEAMATCKAGRRVRWRSMSEGWSIFYIPSGKAKGYYCLNPHTGSNYAFTPSALDKKATTWEVMR